MQKKKLEIKLNHESFITLGEIDNNIITYYESNKLRSKMTINLKKKTLENYQVIFQHLLYQFK